jgi:hypothetical protein
VVEAEDVAVAVAVEAEAMEEDVARIIKRRRPSTKEHVLNWEVMYLTMAREDAQTR